MIYEIGGSHSHYVAIAGYSLEHMIDPTLYDIELRSKGLVPRNQNYQGQSPKLLESFEQYLESYEGGITMMAVAGTLNNHSELYLAMVGGLDDLQEYFPRLQAVARRYGTEFDLETELLGIIAATVLDYHDRCNISYPFNPGKIGMDM